MGWRAQGGAWWGSPGEVGLSQHRVRFGGLPHTHTLTHTASPTPTLSNPLPHPHPAPPHPTPPHPTHHTPHAHLHQEGGAAESAPLGGQQRANQRVLQHLQVALAHRGLDGGGHVLAWQWDVWGRGVAGGSRQGANRWAAGDGDRSGRGTGPGRPRLRPRCTGGQADDVGQGIGGDSAVMGRHQHAHGGKARAEHIPQQPWRPHTHTRPHLGSAPCRSPSATASSW